MLDFFTDASGARRAVVGAGSAAKWVSAGSWAHVPSGKVTLCMQALPAHDWGVDDGDMACPKCAAMLGVTEELAAVGLSAEAAARFVALLQVALDAKAPVIAHWGGPDVE